MNDRDLKITFVLPDGHRVTGKAYPRLNLLTHADTYDLDLPQTCGGQAECGTCRIRVLDGDVTPARGDEVLLMERHTKRFRDGERLSCRTHPRSSVTVSVLALMPPDLRDFEEDDLQHL